MASFCNVVLEIKAIIKMPSYRQGCRSLTVHALQGTVRRILISMPGCKNLASEARENAGCNARVAVLFSNGHFGVWELDHNELQFVSSPPKLSNMQEISNPQESSCIF